MKFHRFGFDFTYRGDAIMWLFPWERRSFNKRFVSYSFEAVFTSLKEIDKMWEEYWKEQI